MVSRPVPKYIPNSTAGLTFLNGVLFWGTVSDDVDFAVVDLVTDDLVVEDELDRGEGHDAAESDSNASNNPANDYPDTEPSSRDPGSDEGEAADFPPCDQDSDYYYSDG